MAILTSMWLKGAKKRLAGTVIYSCMGQTLQRELAASVSNPRSLAQMRQRVKWSNLVSFYRVNSSWMKYAYETKKRTQSEYNKLMSLNVAASTIYLTKQEAAGGACIVAPYIVTQGTLPSIEFYKQEHEVRTNLYLVREEDLGEGVPVADLSASIVDANPALQYGDQISFIRLTQMTNGATGIPYVILRKYEMVLSRTNNEPWSNYLPYELLSANRSSDRAWVEVDDNGAAGGFTMVVSRTIGGRTLVSTQSIVTMNMDAIIASYSSQAALERAVASYGTSADAFLSSNAANYGDDTPIDLAINYVEIDGKRYMAGDYIGVGTPFVGKLMRIYCNQPGMDSNSVNIYGLDGDFSGTNVSYADGVITCSIPNEEEAKAVIFKIEVVDKRGVSYVINFAQTKPSLPDLS